MNSYQPPDIGVPIKNNFADGLSSDEDINVNKRKRPHNKRELYSKWYYHYISYDIIYLISFSLNSISNISWKKIGNI